MRWLGTYVHGALLAATLFLVFYTWKIKGESKHDYSEKGQVLVWSESSLPTRVTYKGKDKTVTLSNSTGGGVLPLVTVTKIEKPGRVEDKNKEASRKDKKSNQAQQSSKSSEKQGKDGTNAEASEKNSNEKEHVESFKGNEKSTNFLKDLREFKAKRSLGTPDKEQLSTLGLDPPEAWIEVMFKSGTRKVLVGKATYGTAGRYIMLPETGEVFVAHSNIVSDLKWAASRLKETDPFGDIPSDSSTVTITKNSSTKILVRLKRENDKTSRKAVSSNKWAFSDRPDEESEEADKWMKKFLRLRARKYVAELSGQKPDGYDTAVSVTFKAESDGQKTYMLLKRTADKESGKDEVKYLLESPRLGYYVEVSSGLATDIINYTDELLGNAGNRKQAAENKTKKREN